MKKSIAGIKHGITKSDPSDKIARKLFLSFPAYAFIDKEEIEFEILNEVKHYCKTAYSSIQLAGSAQTGIAFFRGGPFVPGNSDLDIAVIDANLFGQFFQMAHKETKGYTDLTKFPLSRDGTSTYRQFLDNIKIGYINPAYYPKSAIVKNWLEFFDRLSSNYFHLFKSISGAIYASEYYFEQKQLQVIEEYNKTPEKYDNL